MPEKVGQRLQLVRKLYGLSQRELAKKADVANSAISVMEQDSVSPSVASLHKVLSGFPLTITEFLHLNLSSPSYDNPDQETKEAAEGSFLAPNLAHFELEYGEVSSIMLCKKPTSLLVIKGDIELTSLSSGSRLGEGQSVVMPEMTLFKVQVASSLASWVISYC